MRVGSPVHAPIHDDERGSVINLRYGQYSVRYASSQSDRLAAFRLRFEVFNIELNEGLASAYKSGHDFDEFDAVCDHLIVEHIGTKEVVGTYRLQTGSMAKANLGESAPSSRELMSILRMPVPEFYTSLP